MELSVRVLGPLKVDRNGGGLLVTGLGQRKLFAALVQNAGAPVSVERLIDALWETSPPERPRETLHVRITRLRRALGESGPEGVIATEPAGYRLHVPTQRVDAVR